jgi:chromosomal replication initiator protein
MFSAQEIWQQACIILQQNLSPMAFNTWIISNPLTEFRPIGDDRAIGVITSPTAFHSTNVEKNFYAQIKEVLDQITGRNSELQFRVGDPTMSYAQPAEQHVDEQSFNVQEAVISHIPLTEETAIDVSSVAPNLSSPNAAPPTSNLGGLQPISSFQDKLKAWSERPPAPVTQAVQLHSNSGQQKNNDVANLGLFSQTNVQSMTIDRARLQAQKAGLRLDYTFDTFAVSTTNEMAHAAAQAVSNQPGTAYNPLFIYGGVGVGKTHLMHAVGNNILKNNPEAKILYCTGEDFTNEIVSSIQTKKTMQFKEKFRTVDVLLIDDVQFIAGKNTVQEEFFHTFNTITKRAGQVILTSDRPPQEIGLLEDRLRSRFEAGLMVDIQQPSFELRTAILLIKAGSYQMHIPMNIAQIIASKVDSARKIEGIMKTLKSEVELKHREITTELIEEIFRVETEKNRQRIRVKPHDLIKAVADYYHIKPIILRGQQRVKSIVRARHVAMYLLKEELNLPYVEIGRWFSNRDHTSAMHALKKVNQDMSSDEDILQEISEIRAMLVKLSR